MQSIRAYYLLTKPGIIRGNVLVATAAYLFGSQLHVNTLTLSGLLVGTSAIIAAGCVVNNYIDRHIDARMTRTKKRALVTGAITSSQALTFATILGAIGVASLALYVNILTLYIGLVGLFFYVVVYGIAKRKTVHGTLVGTISGATPPVAGYAAATNQLDFTAALLFLTLVVWQMAHFFAIAIFRQKEYQAAHIPVLSVVKGNAVARKQIIFYIMAFTCIAPLVAIFGYASITYGVIMAATGIWWLRVALRRTADDTAWAKHVFGFSLIILLVFSGTLTLDSYLP